MALNSYYAVEDKLCILSYASLHWKECYSSIIKLLLSARYKRNLKAKNLRYIADSDKIFPVSSFAEVVYEICKCK